ncbi:MAG: hypothetical protein FWE36_04770 [Erysipelotrichales bacterium]|nr:hypothetical protein [Erysipelotrichales bacterium]
MKELIIGNIVVEGGMTPENVVTTNTNQTITGQKTFEGRQTFNGQVVMPRGSAAIEVPVWGDFLGVHEQTGRFRFGNSAARGVNLGNLLVSNQWGDQDGVPTNGILSVGNIETRARFRGNGSEITNLNASNLTNGTIPLARLISTANPSAFLRGDGVWAIPPGGAGNVVGVGTIVNGLGNLRNLEDIFTLLTSFNQTAAAGIGELWGTPLRGLLGDPENGGWATCYARRVSFADEAQQLRADRGIIEIIATNPFGGSIQIRRGWVYRVMAQGPHWTGWRNV